MSAMEVGLMADGLAHVIRPGHKIAAQAVHGGGFDGKNKASQRLQSSRAGLMITLKISSWHAGWASRFVA
jgi:hypothetical protein